jgi:hypothetical protein
MYSLLNAYRNQCSAVPAQLLISLRRLKVRSPTDLTRSTRSDDHEALNALSMIRLTDVCERFYGSCSQIKTNMECAMKSERSEHLMAALLLTASVMFDDSDDSEAEIVLRKVKELSAKQELAKINNYAEIPVQLYYYNIPGFQTHIDYMLQVRCTNVRYESGQATQTYRCSKLNAVSTLKIRYTQRPALTLYTINC